MRRKTLSLSVSLLLVAGALFAHGQSESSASASGKKYAGKTLTALFFSSTYADMAKEYSKQFEQETGAKVQIVTSPFATLHQKEGLALKSGSSAYNIMQVASQWDGEFAPYVTDLEPYIKNSNFNASDIMAKAWAQSGKWNGKTMGVPESYTARLMSYRTDLVPGGIPDTWAKLFDIAKRLNDPSKGFYAFATPGIKPQISAFFNIAFWSLGGRWADKNWNVTIDSPQAREALKIAKEIFAYSNPAALSWGLPEADAAFMQGNAAFDLAWPTLGVTVDGNNPAKSKVVDKWALAQYPHEKLGITVLSAWDVTIPKNAKDKQMAWDWMKGFLSEKEMMAAFKKYSILAPRKSFWSSSELSGSKLAPQGKATAIFWWRIPAGTAAQDVIRNATSNYVSGQATLDQAVSQMKTGLAQALTNNPPPAGVLNLGR